VAAYLIISLFHLILSYLILGDKWQQSPDGKFDEQPQTWLPLHFDSTGSLLPLQMVDSFELDVAV